MADESFNDDDLLLFDVIALIKAYEEGMLKNIRQIEPSEEILLSAYQHPLTALQSTIELSLLSAENSMEEIVNSIVLEERKFAQTAEEEEESSQKEEEEDEDFFYSECSFTNDKGEPVEEWWDVQKGVTRKNLDFSKDSKEPVGYEYRKKFTNKYNRKFGGKVTKYLEEKAPTVNIGDKTYKLSIEECLNCMVDINVELTLPSLEFVFNLDKLLRKIDAMLKNMAKAMDPSLIYSSLCSFLLNFGANFACPANLIGINLVLPTLFAKYTIDLAKVRFDWTSLFGSMIKAVLDYLVQAVEAVPKVINPFIDCIINAFKTIMNAIRALVASSEKVTNEAISAVNNVGAAIQKITPNSWFDPVSVDIKQEYDGLLKDMQERLKEEKEDMDEYEREELPEELEEFAEWLKNSTLKSGGLPYAFENIEPLLKEYLKDSDNADLKHYLEYSYKESSSKVKEAVSVLKPEYQKKIDAAQKREKLESEKDFFNFDFVSDTKSITTPWFSKADKPNKRINFDFRPNNGSVIPIIGPIEARDVSVQKSDWNALDYAFAKYGVDIKNEYRQPKDLIDYRAKGWVRKLNESSPFQVIEKYIIGYLLLAKKTINEVVSKVVQTLKALQAFMGDVIESEFKIIGDMQFVAHLIRFIRLIMKLFEEGLSCENVKKNKQLVESMIAENNRNVLIESSSESIVLEGVRLDPEDYIKIKHRVTQNSTIIDLNECSNLNSMIKVKKDNLDSIYEGILNGLQT